MRVEIEVPDYRPGGGVRLVWDDEHDVAATFDGTSVVVRANASGLRSLARHLLTLAHLDVPSGHHVHLDASNGLKAGSCSLVLEKV